MGYIGAHGVAALHRYKYSGVDHSYVAKYVLQPFWTRCVHFFPLWMPPNGITLMGFMFLVTSALLGYIYSPQLDSPPPRWIHFAHGLLLFLYQTFDAVDGKQARRTSSSSPLGELFDHGCDALACAFESLAFGSTAMCGRNTFWFWVISAVPFYCATWESYFTNTLILPVVNGPTEGLMLIYMTHFFTAFVGAEWWAQSFGKSIPLLSWVPFVNEVTMNKTVLFFMIIFAVIPTVAFNVQNVHKVVKARKGSMLQALAMLYPFVVLLGGVLAWDHFSPSDVMGNYPHLVILGSGLAFGFLVGRLILAHLCDEPKGLKTNMCMSLFYLPLAIANALTALLNDGVPLVDEFWVSFFLLQEQYFRNSCRFVALRTYNSSPSPASPATPSTTILHSHPWMSSLPQDDRSRLLAPIDCGSRHGLPLVNLLPRSISAAARLVLPSRLRGLRPLRCS